MIFLLVYLLTTMANRILLGHVAIDSKTVYAEFLASRVRHSDSESVAEEGRTCNIVVESSKE